MRTSSFLSVVLFASACKPQASAPVDAGHDAGAFTRKPATRVRHCPSFEACASSCTGSEAQPAGCYEAALYALEGHRDGGRDLSVVTFFAALACDKGEGRGCVRAQRPSDALKALPAQCERGDAEACELLASSQLEADAGSEAALAASRAVTLLERECEKKEPFACGRLGAALVSGRLGASDPKRGLLLLEASCEGGVAGSCVELALLYGRGTEAIAPEPARAKKFGKIAKELSDALP